MKRILYKFLKNNAGYKEAILYQEESIPPKTFCRIGMPGQYGQWYDTKDIIIQEFPEKSDG